MGLRTGRDYLASLSDDRQIIHDGRRIDVTTEKGFRNAALAVAQFYDFQNQPEVSDVMTYVTDEGERAGMAFKEARSPSDLRQRAAAYQAWAEVTCGFMGRSPDYMNTCMAALASASGKLALINEDMALRARQLYERARREDLCLTHTFVDPYKVATDQLLSAASQFRVVKETSDGIVVSGPRGLATLAPFANLNFNMGAPPIVGCDGLPLSSSFIVPVAAKNVRWICRSPMDAEAPHWAAPLSGRADELDCVAVFDECFIPWEDVFAHFKGLELVAALRFSQTAIGALRHHTIIRFIAKTKFMLGLAHLLAESGKTNQFINVRERLGEFVYYLHAMEAFAVASVASAELDPETGTYAPHYPTVRLATTWSGQFYSSMVNTLLDLGASRMVSSPSEQTFEVLGNEIEKYFRAASSDGKQNVALHRLAWDVAGSSFGVRQALYERFHFGDRTLGTAAAYGAYDKETAIAMVRRILDVPPADGARFPVSNPASGKKN